MLNNMQIFLNSYLPGIMSKLQGKLTKGLIIVLNSPDILVQMFWDWLEPLTYGPNLSPWGFHDIGLLK